MGRSSSKRTLGLISAAAGAIALVAMTGFSVAGSGQTGVLDSHVAASSSLHVRSNDLMVGGRGGDGVPASGGSGAGGAPSTGGRGDGLPASGGRGDGVPASG